MKLDRCYLCGSNNSHIIHNGVRRGEIIDALQCDGCGLVRLSEVMDEPDEFYRESGMRDGLVESLEKLRLETRDDDVRRFRFTEKMITNKRVLDFGCGDGGYLLRAKTVASEAVGVELEKTVREALRAEGMACYERISEVGKMDVVTYLYTMDTLRLLATKAGLQVKFMRQVQRYPLENHLYWLSQGKPGGHFKWSFMENPALNQQYEMALTNLGIADTIVCGLCRTQ